MQLELTDIALDYGARRVFANITLTVARGEVLVVAGHNGSGKSSLLRVLCGLQRASHGSVALQVDGRSYAPVEARPLIGWVAPDLQLYRELTALENLRFFADVRGLHRSDATLTALLGEVGLDGRGDDLLAAYSSGMAQRLRYAYALLHAPPLLLLDEPTATLDERGAVIVERLIARQRAHGITVVATNDPRELRWGDYVLRLS